MTGSLPPNPTVSMSALFNTSSSAPGAIGAVRIFSFDSGNNWPTWTVIAQQQSPLDASAQTWQPITLAPTPIPSNTDWILAEVYYVNGTLGLSGNNGYVDNARLTFGSVPEPSAFVLGAIGLGAAAWSRRRLKSSKPQNLQRMQAAW